MLALVAVLLLSTPDAGIEPPEGPHGFVLPKRPDCRFDEGVTEILTPLCDDVVKGLQASRSPDEIARSLVSRLRIPEAAGLPFASGLAELAWSSEDGLRDAAAHARPFFDQAVRAAPNSVPILLAFAVADPPWDDVRAAIERAASPADAALALQAGGDSLKAAPFIAAIALAKAPVASLRIAAQPRPLGWSAPWVLVLLAQVDAAKAHAAELTHDELAILAARAASRAAGCGFNPIAVGVLRSLDAVTRAKALERVEPEERLGVAMAFLEEGDASTANVLSEDASERPLIRAARGEKVSDLFGLLTSEKRVEPPLIVGKLIAGEDPEAVDDFVDERLEALRTEDWRYGPGQYQQLVALLPDAARLLDTGLAKYRARIESLRRHPLPPNDPIQAVTLRIAAQPVAPFHVVPFPASKKATPFSIDWRWNATMPPGLAVVRREISGARGYLIAVGDNVDASGYALGGYWFFESDDAGKTWIRSTYLGLCKDCPWAIAPVSTVPMVDGDKLRLEAREHYRDNHCREGYRDAVLLEASIADLKLDSDKDGLTDVVERRLLTDPNNPDTDGDGIPDGRDPRPLVPATEADSSRHDQFVAAILDYLANRYRPFDYPESSKFVVTSEAQPPKYIFVHGNRHDRFRGVRSAVRQIVWTDADALALKKRTGGGHALYVQDVLIDHAGKRGAAIWVMPFGGGGHILGEWIDGHWQVSTNGEWSD